MPVRETYQPYPTVGITPTAAPMQHIASSPVAFGAGVNDQTGRGLEKLGEGVLTAGNTGEEIATRAAALHNDAVVNETVSDFNTKLVDALHKPESAPGAQDGGFYTKRGDNAGTGYQAAQGNLEKLYADTLGGLANDRQRISFEADARRMLNYAKQGMGSHVDKEITASADAKVGSALSALGQEASLAAQQGDLTHFDQVVTAATGKSMEHAANRGFGDDWGKQYAAKWVGQTVGNAAKQAADGGDLRTASSLLAKYGPEMDPASVLSVKTALKTRMKQQEVNAFVNQGGPFSPGAGGGAPAPGGARMMPAGFDAGGFAQGIVAPGGPEGTTANPRSSAKGPGQFIDDTWLKTARGEPEAQGKSDAELLAMRTQPENAQFALRMTEKLATQNATALSNAGLPVNDSTVYLAHFLGAEGAIKTLSMPDPQTPISFIVGPKAVAANPEVLGGGKTVGDVQRWATQAAASIRPGTAVRADKALMLAAADDRYRDDPEARQMAHAQINQKFLTEQLAATADEKQQRDAASAAETGYLRQIFDDPTKINVQAIARDPAFTQYPEKIKGLHTLVQQQLQHLARGGESPGDGAEYWKLFNRVVAPPSDPDKLTNADDLFPVLQASTGAQVPGLTPNGYMKLRTLIEGNRTQESKQNNQDLAGYLKALDPQYKKPGGLMDDPRGGEFFNQARNQVEKAWSEGLKNKIPAADMLDPKNKAYIGNSISVRPRPLDEVLADLRKTAGLPVPKGGPASGAPPGAAPAQPIDTTNPDAVRAAVAGGRMTREQGQAIAIDRGWIRGPGPEAAAGPAVPLR